MTTQPPLTDAALSRPLRLQIDNFTDNMWGGDWIPRMKGLPAPAQPVGESWEFSAHPQHPSLVTVDRFVIPLTELLAASGQKILGERAAARLAGRPPFLLKFIDSRDDLSVQVHPSDDYARAHETDLGKPESWVIADAGTGADEGCIYIGFNPNRSESFGDEQLFSEAFLAAIQQANSQGPSMDPAVRERAARLVLPFLNRVRVRAGEVYDLPPGTVHAIGRGVRLFEIQASSDLTYRVWDWNRPDAKKLKEGKMVFRELHLDRAREVLDFHALPPEHYRRVSRKLASAMEGNGLEEMLVSEKDGRYAASRVRLEDGGALLRLPKEFQVLTGLLGTGVVECGGARELIGAGQSVLIPACAPATVLRCDGGPAEILRSFLPA